MQEELKDTDALVKVDPIQVAGNRRAEDFLRAQPYQTTSTANGVVVANTRVHLPPGAHAHAEVLTATTQNKISAPEPGFINSVAQRNSPRRATATELVQAYVCREVFSATVIRRVLQEEGILDENYEILLNILKMKAVSQESLPSIEDAVFLRQKSVTSFFDRSANAVVEREVSHPSCVERIVLELVELAQRKDLAGENFISLTCTFVNNLSQISGKSELPPMPSVVDSLYMLLQSRELSEEMLVKLCDLLEKIPVERDYLIRILQLLDHHTLLWHPAAYKLAASIGWLQSTSLETGLQSSSSTLHTQERAWFQEQEARVQELTEELSHPAQQLFDSYELLSRKTEGILNSQMLNEEKRRVGMEFELSHHDATTADDFNQSGWQYQVVHQRQGVEGCEVRRDLAHTVFDDTYKLELGKLRLWTQQLTQARILSCHIHIDNPKDQYMIPRAFKLFSTGDKNAARGSIFRNLTKHSIEFRLLRPPRVAGSLDPRMLTEAAILFEYAVHNQSQPALETESDSHEVPKIIVEDWDAVTLKQLIWGAFCRAVHDPKLRLSVLILLQDDQALLNYDFSTLANSFTPLSSLLEFLQPYIEDSPIKKDALKQIQHTMSSAGIAQTSAEQTPDDFNMYYRFVSSDRLAFDALKQQTNGTFESFWNTLNAYNKDRLLASMKDDDLLRMVFLDHADPQVVLRLLLSLRKEAWATLIRILTTSELIRVVENESTDQEQRSALAMKWFAGHEYHWRVTTFRSPSYIPWQQLTTYFLEAFQRKNMPDCVIQMAARLFLVAPDSNVFPPVLFTSLHQEQLLTTILDSEDFGKMKNAYLRAMMRQCLVAKEAGGELSSRMVSRIVAEFESNPDSVSDAQLIQSFRAAAEPERANEGS